MEQLYIIDGLKAQLNMDLVLHAIDCMPDSPVYEKLKAVCREHGVGVLKRLKAQHDCRKCSNTDCRNRNIPDDARGIEITVIKGDEIKKLLSEEGQSVMDLLIQNGYYISAVCGGKGRCGKCKVRVLKGLVPVTAEDEKFFAKEELDAGWRLSCLMYPTEDLTVAFELGDEPEFVAVSEYDAVSGRKKDSRTETCGQNGGCDKDGTCETEYYIAIDIGTTTIAMQLLGNTSGDIKHTITTVNSQRKYGADVITRIKASVDGKKSELKECILKDLKEGIQALLKATGVEMSKVTCIAIAGNTTMIHLLMGYDCDSLGVHPFTPVNIDMITGSVEEVLEVSGNAKVVILPGISTYVGGDIVSGLYACGFDEAEEIKLLVDLGTNGEMVLGNRDKLLVTSTAAGPAFEGGNIEWGMGSVAGAICKVTLDGVRAKCHTILDKEPVGICGTGVVEAVAELLREDILDDTGLLVEEYFDDGFELAKTGDGQKIVLTQKDIRELQLSKSAIRAGIETLLIRYGIEKSKVSKVYLAGGFGYRLNTDKAIAIGMLPEEFADITEAVGNSSLAGVVKYLIEPAGREALEKIISVSEEISLSTDKDFNEFYMEHIMFEK